MNAIHEDDEDLAMVEGDAEWNAFLEKETCPQCGEKLVATFLGHYCRTCKRTFLVPSWVTPGSDSGADQ